MRNYLSPILLTTPILSQSNFSINKSVLNIFAHIISNSFSNSNFRVHGMYRELYASREKLTSIRIRQLDKSVAESVLVPCREMISKIAISDDLLVCQSKEKVKIWSKISNSGETIKYEQASAFTAPEKCNLLVCGGNQKRSN